MANPLMVKALDPVEHYVFETLRSGVDRDGIRRTLDTRLLTVLSDLAESDPDEEELRTLLDVYVRSVVMLNQTHFITVTRDEGER